MSGFPWKNSISPHFPLRSAVILLSVPTEPIERQKIPLAHLGKRNFLLCHGTVLIAFSPRKNGLFVAKANGIPGSANAIWAAVGSSSVERFSRFFPGQQETGYISAWTAAPSENDPPVQQTAAAPGLRCVPNIKKIQNSRRGSGIQPERPTRCEKETQSASWNASLPE